MRPDHHSRRFDPRRSLPIIGTDGAALFGTPAASPRPSSEASRYDPVGVRFDGPLAEFDQALAEIVTDGDRACPLCGRIESLRG